MVTLEEVVADTMLHTRCVMLGMHSPNLATVQLVVELRSKVQHAGSLFTAYEAMTAARCCFAPPIRSLSRWRVKW